MEPDPPDMPPGPNKGLLALIIVLMVIGGVLLIAGGICVASFT